ncbi:MAG: hypothetical protein HGA96_16770 [Desulfobulbaceae bacterium]|nr:hypothetical protein [Desulfobulbaceae bacterium]
MKKILAVLCWTLLLMAHSPPVQAELPEYVRGMLGSLGGQIQVEGKIQAQAVVSFFNAKNGLPPLTEGLGRVPEFISRTDHAGDFKINLPPGRYYIGILVRNSGSSPGPPRPGEKFYFAATDRGQLLLRRRNRPDLRKAWADVDGKPGWASPPSLA